MTHVNPVAVCFIALCAVLGAILGSVLIGLAVGLGVVVIASLS